MTKAQQFLALHEDGYSVSQIAARMNVRFQHVYNTLRRYGLIQPRTTRSAPAALVSQVSRPLSVETLAASGFARVAAFTTKGDEFAFDRPLPAPRGVYAICAEGMAQYVGVASIGIAARLKFYLKPAATQRTSIRVRSLVLELLAKGIAVDVLTAFPTDHVWNNLPVDGCAGLESGLIAAHYLPWNIRGARRR